MPLFIYVQVIQYLGPMDQSVEFSKQDLATELRNIIFAHLILDI